ncbi:SepM family pheromone-processing serine protease [Streptococcus hyovaginalis]|uniref:SepM family pheromone-processing serine protease n=1 Tax=Streptococcus hyovaginalis TaxID=149015 RepID=UPI002A914B63|nr:SepM family pheromone-processing serine protease [Streptococcus hyovaginalis]MDY5973917.1 SepM family pheromone-processing serine protease [Streptococcus hyovaginalis]
MNQKQEFELIEESPKKSSSLKWWLLGIISAILLGVAFFVPLPYYIEMPGGAYDIRQVLKVDNKEDKEKGSYHFVAISQMHATFAGLVYAWLTPFTDISTAQESLGDYTEAEYLRLNQFYMETSQNEAIYQAFKLADKPVDLKYFGVYVLDVTKDSTFKGILGLADTVTGVNGQTFESSKDLIDYVAKQKIGDKVTVQYLSDDKEKEASGKIIKLDNGKNGIGIGLVDHTEVETKIPVTFSTGNVGGPSAGLMFTLDILDQINDEDLRKGRQIAGTGTIEQDGSVGDIGGADKKVVSAAKDGIDIFFVPNNPIPEELLKQEPDAKTNYQEAKEAAKKIETEMKIVPVKTVQEAIDYLKKTS